MKAFFILAITLLMLIPYGDQAVEPSNREEKMTTYFFIRHAEKDTSNPHNRNPVLSPEGIERSLKWAAIFKEVSFDLIYSTDLSRTRQTAEAIAKGRDVQIQFYDPRKMNDEDFQEATKGRSVLVVGHSNTNPQFVNSIIRETKYRDIDESESGSLFIVSVSPTGETSSQLLYIN